MYEHPAYGTARIELRRGALVWRWRDDEAPLAHFHYDTFTTQAEQAGRAVSMARILIVTWFSSEAVCEFWRERQSETSQI